MHVDFGSLLDLHDKNGVVREAVAHNVGVLRCIRGGLRMTERYRVPFDPRLEYWRRPERRFAVAYLAHKWTGRFFPPVHLRRFALDLVQHADRARRDGIVTFIGVQYELAGGIDALCEALTQHFSTMPSSRAWEALRVTWPKLRSPAEDVAEFVSSIPNDEDWEPGFARRLPWLGYLDAGDEATLRARQAYFFGFANLWTMSNAYRRAGAQAFAPVLQNTSSALLLEKALLWSQGSTPVETGFETLARDDSDDVPQDRATYAAVIEVYGFLNLHRAPFYNNLAEEYRQWFAVADGDAYELTSRVGEKTTAWLAQHPAVITELAARLRTWCEVDLHTRVQLEAIESPRVRKTHAADDAPLLDQEFVAELAHLADSELGAVSERDAAAIALHLLLDAKLYTEKAVPPVLGGNDKEKGASDHRKKGPSPVPPAEVLVLPEGLRPVGERALAYLRAGLHVLLAGAPGTGKTTLAQFVGYAWDKDLPELPTSLPIDDAPLTTVGNSAWSPFHTVGGLVPDGKDKFKAHGGVFIEPASTTETTWTLRGGALVLDEMNRADLDRCIGDLYPLLSGSVAQVVPAGLPGVERIVANPRFRVLATVNDSNLDDIVFPISEGLARRFQRIELQGGTRDDIIAYLGITESSAAAEPRHAAAIEALDVFFEVAREHHLLKSEDVGERLHFGVAYFALLQAWVTGRLPAAVLEATRQEQARDLLAASLTTLTRAPQWREALRAFKAKG